MNYEEIKRLRERGFSYGEISKLVKKPKKFIWEKSKNVKFTNKGKLRYHKNVKGIINRIKLQSEEISIQKVRIIGHILFDGMLTKSKEYNRIARYVNSSKNLINQFIGDVKKVYGLKPTSIETEEGINLPTYKVSFSSKLMYQDLLNYLPSYSTTKDISLPSIILYSDKESKIEFLRTFFDDEGSISAKGRIMADLKSKKIIEQITEILAELGLNFKLTNYEDYKGTTYKIYLPKSKENLHKFYSLRLFDKSIVTHGKYIGKKKLDVLREACVKLKNP